MDISRLGIHSCVICSGIKRWKKDNIFPPHSFGIPGYFSRLFSENFSSSALRTALRPTSFAVGAKDTTLDKRVQTLVPADYLNIAKI
jgi:hypothetical protein